MEDLRTQKLKVNLTIFDSISYCLKNRGIEKKLNKPKHIEGMIASILISFVIVLLFFNVPFAKAQTVERQETSITVRSAVPVDPSLTLNDFRFESVYVVSLVYSKTGNSKTTLRIPENTFKFSHINCSVSDVRIFDNLNNSFQADDDGATITNKEIEVNIPANFEYTFSLSLTSQTEIFFDGVSYVLPVNINPAPDVLTIRFPKNYTVRESSPSVAQEITDEFIVLKWQKVPIVTVKFLPFTLQFTLTSIKSTFDIASVFPAKGQVSLTEEQTFTTPRRFSVWDITPFICVSYDLPPYIEDIEVVKVWDGIGLCNKIDEHVLNPTANEAGNYNVDYKNRVIYVYPRYDYKGEFYQYSTGYEITNSPNVETLKGTIIVQDRFLPYKYTSSCAMIPSDPAFDWKINLTESIKIKFILPEKSEIDYGESEKPLIGMEANRPTATYYVDPSANISSTYVWFITYEMVSLRFYFWLAISFMIGFMLLIVIIAICYIRNSSNRKPKHRKFELGGIISISTLFLGTNIGSFQTLGGYNNTFVIIFAISIVVWLSFIIFYFLGERLLAKIFRQKSKNKSKRQPSAKTVSQKTRHSTPLEDKHNS
jgi:hypothetical protein